MSKELSFALIHSPLVGPYCWQGVAEHLQKLGYSARVPTLTDKGNNDLSPYWQQHAQVAAHALQAIPSHQALVLVGHSGTGPLLPSIAQMVQHSIAGYLFCDAGLPHPGQSRLEEMETTSPEFGKELREYLASGGYFPNWTEETLAQIIPDRNIRIQLLAELQPRPLAFFEETLPFTPFWPDAPCGYLQLSKAYEPMRREAQSRSWACQVIEAGHFGMLVEPAIVTQTLLELWATFT